MDIEATLTAIRAHHRAARFAIGQQQRLNRALEAHICYDHIGLPHGADKKTRVKAWKETKAMIRRCQSTGEAQLPVAPEIIALVQATALARKPFDKIRREHEKAMRKLARTLPIWPAWAKDMRGIGELSLAQLLGETGDLSGYATVSKVWKRMGLAVFDGKRQGAPGEGASKDDWIRHGYNGQRRSVAHIIGENLIRAKNADYTGIYQARKIYESDRVKTKLHAHRRALRYMEKQLLADLWSAWRAAARPALQPIGDMPPPTDLSEAA